MDKETKVKVQNDGKNIILIDSDTDSAEANQKPSESSNSLEYLEYEDLENVIDEKGQMDYAISNQ